MRNSEIEYDYILHDMRVQMQLLLGNVDWLVLKASGNAITAGGVDVTENILAAQDNANHAVQLLNTLLTRDADGEIYELRLMIERVIKNVQTVAYAKDKRCVFEINGEFCAKARVRDLERALYNLLSNAIRHTAAGATIRVRAFNESDCAVVCVEDDGPPLGKCEICVLENEKGRQCERFTGMGLRIVRNIVENLQGSIQVCSQDHYKSIRLRIPLSSASGD